MSTRATEASALNSTLDTLETQLAAWLAAGQGDIADARAAFWSALAYRLVPIIGPAQFRTPSSHSNISGVVPDQVREDELAG